MFDYIEKAILAILNSVHAYEDRELVTVHVLFNKLYPLIGIGFKERNSSIQSLQKNAKDKIEIQIKVNK